MDDDKVSVKTAPFTASYQFNFSAGKNAIFSLNLEAFYSDISYFVNEVAKEGNYFLAGIGSDYLWLFKPKSFIHSLFLRLVYYPFAQFSVKSTSTTDITVQNQSKSLITQTVLTYSGKVALKFDLGLLRYLGGPFGKKSNLHYGIASGFLYQIFNVQNEQSLQKIAGQNPELRSPTQTDVKYIYQLAYAAFVFGLDI